GRGHRRSPRPDRGTLLGTLPDPPPPPRGDVAPARRSARPPDRRARPHRRTVRGVPPRGALGLPGDDPGTRHDPRRGTADRGPHLEPHARGPRRTETALSLSLGRLSLLRPRTRDPDDPCARGVREPLARGRRLHP